MVVIQSNNERISWLYFALHILFLLNILFFVDVRIVLLQSKTAVLLDKRLTINRDIL